MKADRLNNEICRGKHAESYKNYVTTSFEFRRNNDFQTSVATSLCFALEYSEAPPHYAPLVARSNFRTMI